jgi:hypothetical protein
MAFLSTYARVIYASRWAEPGRQDVHDLLADIVAASVRNNLMAGVTGLLLYRQGWFLQALEGDLDGVDRAFDRIRRDRRHFDVHVVADEAVFERVFPDWSMCASDIHDIPASILAGLGLAGTFDPGRLDAGKALALLLAAAEARRDAGVRAA